MAIYKKCLYCERGTLIEGELFIREENLKKTGKTLFLNQGEKITGNVTFLTCENCGFIHPFNTEVLVRNKQTTISKGIKWNIQ